jgi:NADPH:quinone reductase
VIALILNYVTAHQMIHRFATMQPRQTALVTGANGGVGTALLELLRAHEVRALGLVSRKHFDLIKSLGGEPIESRTKSVEIAVHEVLPGGVDVAFDGLGGPRTRECIRALRRGGLVVGYGFMAAQGTGGFGGLSQLPSRSPFSGLGESAPESIGDRDRGNQ